MSLENWLGVFGFIIAFILAGIKVWETFYLKPDLHIDVVRGLGRELGTDIRLIVLRVCLSNRGRAPIALGNFRLKGYFHDRDAPSGYRAVVIKNFETTVRLIPDDLLVEDFTYQLQKATRNQGQCTLTLEWRDHTGQRYVVQHPEFMHPQLKIDFGKAKVIPTKYAGEIEPTEL